MARLENDPLTSPYRVWKPRHRCCVHLGSPGGLPMAKEKKDVSWLAEALSKQAAELAPMQSVSELRLGSIERDTTCQVG